jgi:hypothetical protein
VEALRVNFQTGSLEEWSFHAGAGLAVMEGYHSHDTLHDLVERGRIEITEILRFAALQKQRQKRVLSLQRQRRTARRDTEDAILSQVAQSLQGLRDPNGVVAEFVKSSRRVGLALHAASQSSIGIHESPRIMSPIFREDSIRFFPSVKAENH